MDKTSRNIAVVGSGLALLAVLGWMGWQQRGDVPGATSGGPVVPADVLPPPAPTAAPPAPLALVPEPTPAPDLPPIASASVEESLTAMLGRQAVLSQLQTDRFAHRLVVTVDNLGRSFAPASTWPVVPTRDRFLVLERDGRNYISPDNGLRYTPLVALAESVEPRVLAQWYARLLPVLQTAYEEAGYPNRRFHGRLIEVIDQMLATPPAPEWMEVQLTEVRGPVPSERPWVRYEFVDPALEQASAGQKLMLRVGAENQRRLKARLQALRAELAALGQGR
jgi:hypothetical protein